MGFRTQVVERTVPGRPRGTCHARDGCWQLLARQEQPVLFLCAALPSTLAGGPPFMPPPQQPPAGGPPLADCLRTALAMLRPDSMGHVRRFVLQRDPEVDLGILRSPRAIACASLLDGERLLVNGTGIDLAAIRLPFLNIGVVNIGLVVGRVSARQAPAHPASASPASPASFAACTSSPRADGTAPGMCCGEPAVPPTLTVNMRTRSLSIGRYCRNEATGEALHVLSDVRDGSSSTVSLIWFGPRREDTLACERMDVICDAAKFAAGTLLGSVIRCERTTRVRDGPPRPPLRLPKSPTDLSVCAENVTYFSGVSRDFVATWRPKGTAALTAAPADGGTLAFTESFSSLDGSKLQSCTLRHMLVGIAVQARMGHYSPVHWTMSPVTAAYAMALRISATWAAADRSPTALEARGESGVDGVANVTSSSATAPPHETVAPSGGAATCKSFRQTAVTATPRVGPEMRGVSDASAVPFLGVSRNLSQGPFAAPAASQASTSSSPARSPLLARAPCRCPSRCPRPCPCPRPRPFPTAARASASAAALPSLPATAPAPDQELSSGQVQARGQAPDDRERMLEETRRKHSARRARNIEAAKRSNARRKAANVELAQQLELAQAVERVLRRREAELRVLNDKLRRRALMAVSP